MGGKQPNTVYIESYFSTSLFTNHVNLKYLIFKQCSLIFKKNGLESY